MGDRFASFIRGDDPVSVGESGWADFDLDDRSRVILADGDFGTEVTSPVMWLTQEYGLDITCVKLEAYEHDGEHLVQGQRIIPVPEAEEYMTKRREKQEQQQSSRRPSTFTLLIERGVLREGDELLFNEAMFDEEWAPQGADERWDPNGDLWRAVVTGKRGQSNNVRWCYDDEEYSFTGLSLAILSEITGEEDPYVGDAFWYWTHPEFEYENLSDLRDKQVSLHDRKEGTAS